MPFARSSGPSSSFCIVGIFDRIVCGSRVAGAMVGGTPPPLVTWYSSTCTGCPDHERMYFRVSPSIAVSRPRNQHTYARL